MLPPSVAPANDWSNKFDQRLSKAYETRENLDKPSIEETIVEANDNWFDAFKGLTARSGDRYIDRKTVDLNEIEESEINPLVKDWNELERALSNIPSDCIGIPNQSGKAFSTYFKILGAIADACEGRKGLDLAIRWSGAISLQGRTASNYYSPSRVSYEFCLSLIHI